MPVLDPELAGVWVDAQFTCVDFVEESTRALSTQSHGSLDEDAYAGCPSSAFTQRRSAPPSSRGSPGTPTARPSRPSRAQLVCSRQAYVVTR